jgi:hypothetical protein
VTIQTKQSISLDEIEALQFECVNDGCNAKIILSPERWDKIPSRCPSCNRRWWQMQTEKSDSAENSIRDFQRSLKRLVELSKKRDDFDSESQHKMCCDVTLQLNVSSHDPVA